MGLLAIGRRALGFSSGLDVNVGNEEPGPHKMRASNPTEGIDTAWGMAGSRCGEIAGVAERLSREKLLCVI
jgi:hypothetical protein